VPQNDGRNLLLAAAFVLGALGVAAAFVMTIGGFDGAVDLAQRILSRIDQVVR
jgi:hypothetical protein